MGCYSHNQRHTHQQEGNHSALPLPLLLRRLVAQVMCLLLPPQLLGVGLSQAGAAALLCQLLPRPGLLLCYGASWQLSQQGKRQQQRGSSTRQPRPVVLPMHKHMLLLLAKAEQPTQKAVPCCRQPCLPRQCLQCSFRAQQQQRQ
jgi:hypothetical protein